jgi:lysyl-tRNA synthetase class 2
LLHPIAINRLLIHSNFTITTTKNTLKSKKKRQSQKMTDTDANANNSQSQPPMDTQNVEKEKVFIASDGTVCVSKNQLKKYNKKLQTEKKKRNKKANQPKTNISEKNLSPNQYFEIRQQMVANCEKNNINVYPHKFVVTSSVPQYLITYANLETQEQLNQLNVSVAGRVMNIRRAGGKLRFYDIQGDGSSMQVVANAADFKPSSASASASTTKKPSSVVNAFKLQHVNIRRGDIIGVQGFPGKTRAGELSIFARNTLLLAPCLRMMPSIKHGHALTDKETRYRQRYLDLILRAKTREIFYTRSKIINYIRRFLDARGFLEVETPQLNQMAGGAAAKPFKTWHNDLGVPMYLRIAPELYLKELIIGGLDRVYEIGRQFRNEGIDMTHNPEFTTCEFYAAYWDYQDLMKVTEEMIAG